MASPTYKELLGGINAFLFDVDGVFTDNRTLLIPDMDPVRVFHTRDAFAVQHAVKEGLRIIIITGGRSKGVADSFGRLGVTEFHNSIRNKAELFDRLVAETGLDPQHTAYMGDDIPDMRVMQRVALPCCPADAAEEIKAVSRYVSRYAGGGGCVRDLLEQAMKAQGRWLTDGAYTW